jgi:hypothetical protein
MTNRFSSWRDSFPPVPPHRTAADKILANTYGAKIELLKFTDDDGVSEASMTFQIEGSIDNQSDANELLRALLAEFNSPAGGEASHAS